MDELGTKKMKKNKVLVTGAAGFMGSHVAEHCLHLGMEVVAVDDLSGGFERNVPTNATFVKGDLRSVEFVRSLWEHGPFDYVYHLAAYAAEGLSHFIRRFNYETNLLASVNLINASINSEVKCFVFTSSIAVYGRNQLPMREELTPHPEDPYGVSKLAVELDLAASQELFGLNYVIFRPHNVYGERQNLSDKYRNVIGIFIRQCLEGEPLTIFGDGRQTRAFSHIDDVAPSIARAPLIQEAYNQVFNVGADEPHTVLRIASEVSQALGRPLNVKHLAPRNEVIDAFADHSRVQSVFGRQTTVPIGAGIERMAKWALLQPRDLPMEFYNIEVRKNLPDSWRARVDLG
jgi:UDP-glucose 4-epimerase